MKLLRHGTPGRERPGAVDATGRVRDLTGIVPDIGPDQIGPEGLARLRGIDLSKLPEVPAGTRLGPCVAGIGKIVCIGLNYARHARETGGEPPAEPIIFMKATSALAGPDDPIVIPRTSDRCDWEVELGVVIGRKATNIGIETALDHVAGYCSANDVSERTFQSKRGGQWTKGKSCDTFGPIGPWLVTADEVPDPQALDLWCEVNGERLQASSTSDMIFGVAHIVAYVSEFMSLMPGDVIMTGTPEGVGMGMRPQRFLKPGDTLRCGVGGLGDQTHRLVAFGAD